MTTEPCDFERLCERKLWYGFPVTTGAKRRKVRCPRCGKRLRLRSNLDRGFFDETTVISYRIPPHKTTIKRLAWQLRLPGVK